MPSRIERANAIRALAMDAVQRANSGHPGAPMGLADVAEVLFRKVVRHNPGNPAWIDRDRFVLSNGHGSMLLYAVLHLTGYGVTVDDLKRFRQLHSNTPGHPERGETPGVETTTGPLGQGFANGVGMAMAERELARTFNRPGFDVIDHRTWVVMGDGCLMEGISHEAASFAGTLGLGKLKVLWDDNGISIDGETKGWFTEDVAARFEAYGWRVIRGVDGHDPDSITKALADATRDDTRPTFVCVKTVIGFGAPTKQGTAEVHGAALGEEEVGRARRRLNWGYAPFEIPQPIYAEWDGRQRGAALDERWQATFDRYAAAHPELARELMRRTNGVLPERWDEPLIGLARGAQAKPAALETRKSSQACLDAIAPKLPELIGGSADLTGSNNTRWKSAATLTAVTPGNYVYFGVREFGMTAITNGIALHGGFVPFSGTFLVFMDYARNAVRLAALMRLRNVFVYTHDSVGLGEDGPTHQPIEHLTTLRATPNLSLWRPCDTVETAFAWRAALARSDGPTALVLTRQKTSPQTRDGRAFDDVARGGYVLVHERAALAAIVIATGSEVDLAVAAVKSLGERGAGVRVVSMPSTDVFLAQAPEYREAVLPSTMRARVAVEAAHSESWFRFVGLDGKVVSIERYGLSAPGADALKALGMSADAVAAAVSAAMAAHA